MPSKPKFNKTVDSDFINLAVHFNKNTLLTKNGELIQTIRIDGLDKEGRESSQISLRDILRDSIFDGLDDQNKFAFWFHTVRRKKDLTLRQSEKHKENHLTEIVDDAWQENNGWKSQYVNELYISIVSQSTSYWKNKNSGNSLMSFVSQGSLARNEARALKSLAKELSIFTNKILLDLSDHGARLLGIMEWQGSYYSEPMRFLGKIINLEERRYPVTFNDISHDLSHSQIVFGNRDVQVLSKKKSNFCSILSLKEYVEIPLQLMDKILSLNFEFIITQSFDLFYDAKEIESYKENLDIIKISDDIGLEEISGLSNYENLQNKSQKEFGSLQTTITIITDEFENMESEVSSALEEFGSLGLIMVREDIFMEHCFWSRIPGNFPFLKRKKSIKTLQVPGFSAINSLPSGSFDGNIWGPAITTLSTILGTPYFFNFHDEEKSSLLIQSSSNSEINTFTNFLALQSLKNDSTLFFIDSTTHSDIITESLKGKTFRFSNDEDTTSLNPLSLEANEENEDSLLKLLKIMTMFVKGGAPEEEVQNCKQIIKSLLAENNPNFLIAYDKLRTESTKNVYQRLKTWVEGPAAKFFSANEDITFSDTCNIFDLTQLINTKPIALSIFTDIINKITNYARNSQKKCIVVIEEPMKFFNNAFFKDNIVEFIENIEKTNSVVILKHSNMHSLKNHEIYQEISQSCSSKIFFPKSEDEEYHDQEYDIDESEYEALKYMTLHSQKNLIFKKDEMPIILQNNIHELGDLTHLISNDNISVLACNEISNDNPNIKTKELTEQIIEIYKGYEESQKQIALKALEEAENKNDET